MVTHSRQRFPCVMLSVRAGGLWLWRSATSPVWGSGNQWDPIAALVRYPLAANHSIDRRDRGLHVPLDYVVKPRIQETLFPSLPAVAMQTCILLSPSFASQQPVQDRACHLMTFLNHCVADTHYIMVSSETGGNIIPFPVSGTLDYASCLDSSYLGSSRQCGA